MSGKRSDGEGRARPVIQDAASPEQTQETPVLMNILAIGDAEIKAGAFSPASEAIRRVRAGSKPCEAELHARLEAVRDAVKVGLDDADAGCVMSFKTPAELERHLKAIVQDVLAEDLRTPAK
ncbi:hypothetical protein BH11PSE9_BH11PSE9_22910 [soil metagenome]